MTGVICSSHSLQKSNCEQIVPVDLYKRATLSWANRSFDHKKRAICSKNQRANAQPCILDYALGFWENLNCMEHPTDYRRPFWEEIQFYLEIIFLDHRETNADIHMLKFTKNLNKWANLFWSAGPKKFKCLYNSVYHRWGMQFFVKFEL